ncbi:MAG: alpha/beta fold hydrolase [Pseudomonadota bacterium]
MAHFLLIHGASHGAWCWDRLRPELAARGHSTNAIDLPGHGEDDTPRHSVRMADYVARTLNALDPHTILVGHSFGGFPITLAAARAPEKVRALVYVCALVPRPGQAFTAFRADAISQDLSQAQTVDRDAGVTRAIPEKAGSVFYSDCSPEDRDWALERLTPQPIAVMTEPVEFTPPDPPRHYVRCLKDRVIYPAFQEAITQGWDHVYDMNTGHSPFLSDPGGLADILDRIAST